MFSYIIFQYFSSQKNINAQSSTIRRGAVKSAAERRIEANLRSKLSRELERGGVADTLNQAEMVLRNLPKAPQSERVRVRSTNAQRQNSGPLDNFEEI